VSALEGAVVNFNPMKTKTAHQLARELLALPDLPTFFFDPSLAGIDPERDASLTEPRVELNKPPRWANRWPAFITVVGGEDQETENQYIDDLRADSRRLQFVLDTLREEGVDGLKAIPCEMFGLDRVDLDMARQQKLLKGGASCPAK
jgi:hypothetical protein